MTGRLVQHAQAVLDKMVADAKIVEDGDSSLPVWEGSLSKLIAEVAVASQYSAILKVLKGSEAIVQVRRGGGGAPSVWAILDRHAELSTENMRASLARRNTIEDRLDNLERLVGGINVGQALVDHAQEGH